MNKRRAISLVLAFMLMAMPVMNAAAVEGEEGEIPSLDQAGEVMESYKDETGEWEEVTIGSIGDLMAFSRNCWLDTWSLNKKVYLTKDLDLEGREFAPIPTFGGYFDGQGHTISNLHITDSGSHIGLFCYTQRSAVIANLNVEGTVRPSGRQIDVAGIVGNNSGIIANCTFKGIVEGNDFTGGIAGFNELTGIVMDCTSKGNITGAHYTGGIAGENMGNIAYCTNESKVNISKVDEQISLDDVDLAQYARKLWEPGDSDSDSGRTASLSGNVVDTGGIAGVSTGVIQFCTNKGTVGYEHVGYNVGGIAGRQSGYIYTCKNTAPVYGRKDVGGIAGQAEPYIAVNLSEDIAYQLTNNINKLHDLINVMLDDAGTESATLSSRLGAIQSFADKALEDTNILADSTITWADGLVGSANEIFDRTGYIMDEMAKDTGPVAETKDAVGSVKYAAEDLDQAVSELDIYDHMTEDQRTRYDSAKQDIEDATRKYNEAYGAYVDAAKNYYIEQEKGKLGTDEVTIPTEKDLCPKINGNWTVWKSVYDASGDRDETYKIWPGEFSPGNVESYIDLDIEEWGHIRFEVDDSGNVTNTIQGMYPLGDTSYIDNETDKAEQEEMDRQLLENVATAMRLGGVETGARIYANGQYGYSGDYQKDVSDWAETMSSIILESTTQMSDEVKGHMQDAVSDVKDAAGSLEAAGSSTKRIFDDINAREDIELPQLGESYRTRASSLNANLQGISENMGYLNGELLSSNDVLLEDFEAINNQFSSIMLLYTDAVDGVLDVDYSTAYEDQSEEDAQDSTDATIADSENQAVVKGDINVAGIAGTMAIEYDFDLESDVTGIENAKVNSSFLTKCVLRQNENTGVVTAQKSYAGGITGLQELGMVLRCEDYGKVESTSGDHVGGIAGQSLSFVKNSFAKCTVSGGKYVAGIAGSGYRIEDCVAMVKINDATSFFGAIAGEARGEGQIFGNYFVSDEVAGIDRISYSGKAEPVSYQQLLTLEEIPEDFQMMTVRFFVDEEEIERIYCKYGESIPESKYPNIPEKEDHYGEWDKKGLQNITFDQEVIAEYARYLTTLAGEELRDNGQSAILVDGMFKEGAALDVQKGDTSNVIIDDEVMENVAECWKITIPDDGSPQHQIRYQAPEGQTKDIAIYVKKDGTWQETETELMGIYHLFTVEGLQNEIAVVLDEKDIRDHIVYIVIGAVGIAALTIALVRKRKGKATLHG